jgi:hypothetical protein
MGIAGGAWGWLRTLFGDEARTPMALDPAAVRAIATAALADGPFADAPVQVEPIAQSDPPAWRAVTATRGAGVELVIADHDGRILERRERTGR